MLDINFTFLWTALNLVVLYLFLNKFLFKRVGEYMEKRTKEIEENIKKAESMKAEGEEYKAEQQKLLDTAVEKRGEILAEAREKATKDYDEIIKTAKGESARILTTAHDAIERDRNQAMLGMRNEVVSIALSAASKVIEANMDTEKNRKLIDEFLDKEGVA